MLVTLNIRGPVADALALEAGRRGQSPAAWVEARLADYFGCRPSAPAASKIAFLPDNDPKPDIHND